MATRPVAFTIPGIPQQQGSKRHLGNGISIDANKNLKPWREVALSRATDAKPAAADDGPVFVGPVSVIAECYFPRPKGHYRTGRNAGQIKDTAPTWHSSAPDLDKLLRAIGDVLTQSQVVLDDRLIVHWVASKRYGSPRVEVVVSEMPGGSDG